MRELRALVVAAAAVMPMPLAAQHWRTLDVSRQLHDTSALKVRVDFGAGKLALRSGTNTLLYALSLRYDGDLAQPVHTFDQAQRTLSIGTSKGSIRFSGGDDKRATELKLDLARTTPIDLALDLGAVEADLDLSRLRLSRLKLDAGASEARIRFDTLNATPMQSLDLDVAAAGLKVDELANANAREVRVKTTAAGADLDLSGTWTQDMQLTIEVVLGGVTVHVPSDIGVELTVDRFIASVAPEGLTKKGDVWRSDNFATASHKVRIRARTMFGKLTIDRTGQ